MVVTENQHSKDDEKKAEDLTDEEVLSKLFPPETVEIVEDSSIKDKDT